MSQQKRQRPRNNMGKPRSGKVAPLHEGGNVVEGRSKNQLMQSMDRFLNLAREAQSSGDRVSAEGFFQQADHYHRLLNLLNESSNERRAPVSEPIVVVPSDTAVLIEEELMEALGQPEEKD